MTTIGTPNTDTATRIMLLGSGELGREVAIELIRYGCEVIAVDRYANAPAMQVAHRSHVINMLDGQALRQLVEQEKPALIVPEIEAIATDELVKLEQEGVTVVPTARAAQLTMNREGIRRLTPADFDYAHELEMPVPDEVASALNQLRQRLVTQLLSGETVNLPCLLDPYQEEDGQDLASWCAGFMTGVFADEGAWYQDDESTMAEMLLPFVLISGLDEDEALDDIWNNTQLVRQMALSIPDLLEELFLVFHGPENDDSD